MDAMEHLSKPSEDVSEVIFGQPEERAGATGPYGSVLDRRKEDEWLDDTEPCHGAVLGRRKLTGRLMMCLVPQ